MLDSIALPVICAANLCPCATWFVHLKCLMNHPILKEDEKLLWLWLATCCTNNQYLRCSISIEQISQMISKPEKAVHRCLLRLKIMGLLMGDIPIWYGVPTAEMVKEVRHIKLVLINKDFSEVDPAHPKPQVVPIKQKLKINIYKPYSTKLKPNLRWISSVVNFVKKNHNFRVMCKRMLVH